MVTIRHPALTIRQPFAIRGEWSPLAGDQSILLVTKYSHVTKLNSHVTKLNSRIMKRLHVSDPKIARERPKYCT